MTESWVTLWRCAASDKFRVRIRFGRLVLVRKDRARLSRLWLRYQRREYSLFWPVFFKILNFAFHLFPFIGIRWCGFNAVNHRPFFSQFSIELQIIIIL